MSGTSQAAPHVAGVAALLVGLGVRGKAATQRILDTATDIGPAGDDAEYGNGLVNARAAVAGLGGSAPAGGGGPSAGAAPGVTAFARAKKRQRGKRIRVRVRSAVAGRARITVRARNRRIGRRSTALQAGSARTIVVKLNRRGRRMAPVTARVRVRLPGESRIRVLRVRVLR